MAELGFVLVTNGRVRATFATKVDLRREVAWEYRKAGEGDLDMFYFLLAPPARGGIFCKLTLRFGLLCSTSPMSNLQMYAARIPYFVLPKSLSHTLSESCRDRMDRHSGYWSSPANFFPTRGICGLQFAFIPWAVHLIASFSFDERLIA